MGNRRKLRLASLNGNRVSTPSPMSGKRPGEKVADMLDTPGVAGAINAYVCNLCYRLTVVQHIDKGVTPKYMACQATRGCEGSSRTMNYPPDPPQKVVDAVRWEWYRPDLKEYRQLNPEIKQHILTGGLCLREKVR